MTSVHIYSDSPSVEDACTSWTFCLFQLSLMRTDQRAYQPLPIWGFSQYSILSTDALIPFDTGCGVFDGLLLKHFFTQLDTTKGKGGGGNALHQLSSKDVAVEM